MYFKEIQFYKSCTFSPSQLKFLKVPSWKPSKVKGVLILAMKLYVIR